MKGKTASANLYKVRTAHKLDVSRFYNFLAPELEDRNLSKNIKEHIRHGTAYKLQDKTGDIKGVFLAMKFKEHISLSYFLVSKDLRCKPISLQFFLKCMYELKPDLPIYAKKNKNYNTYKNYFEATQDENILLFTGISKKYSDLIITNLEQHIKEHKWVE